MHPLLKKLGLAAPIVQAPMAGVATPALVAAVCNEGALGSLGLGSATVEAARATIAATRAATDRPFNVNVFCHRPAIADRAKEAAWIDRFAPEFARFGGAPPTALREVYPSFVADAAMRAALLEARPAVVSFHFGLPSPETLAAFKSIGTILVATATNLAEGRAVEAAGIDAVVAQGFEAGGHRGVFDEHAPDDRLGVLPLTRLLATRLSIPVIAAGGIMDGAGIAAALRLGAIAAQLGTAYVACPESSADAAHRAALASDAAHRTTLTAALSGRPARCLPNRFTELTRDVDRAAIPAYPIAYDLAKALHAAAQATGESGFGPQWAGQGAPLARALPAAELTARLRDELREALASSSDD